MSFKVIKRIISLCFTPLHFGVGQGRGSNIIKKYLRKLVFLFTYHLYVKPGRRETTFYKLDGFKFIIYPSVFNPHYSVSSKVFAEFIKSLELNGKTVLDMGCGSGIVSIIAASKGAACTAVDVNPMAVKSAVENAKKNGFEDKIKVIESDLFGNPCLSPSSLAMGGGPQIGGGGAGLSFDIIFFNPPYYKGTAKNNFEAAFKGGENLEVIGLFLAESINYLKKDGYIYLIISSDLGMDEFKKIVNLQLFKFEIVQIIKKFFETFFIIRLFN
jgi:release factor glutamine methyltransferase